MKVAKSTLLNSPAAPNKQYRGVIKLENNSMSRQVNSVFTSSAQASGVASIPTTTVESMGVTKDFTTLEVRATLAKKGENRNAQNTLFTFHGGSVMKSSKTKSMFLAMMPRPFVFTKGENKEIQINKETGELQHSSVKSFKVRAVETQVPEMLKPLIEMLKVTPAEQRQVAMEVAKLQLAQLGVTPEAFTQYLYGTDALEHEEICPGKLLRAIYKDTQGGSFENIRFKANISSKWENKIESILDKISGGDEKYSIVLRFDLTKFNSVKELVELQYYKDGNLVPRRHPLTGDVILLQEVTLPLTYIGIEKGSTYDEDTSKYIAPSIVLNALDLATKDVENPTYMDYSVIQARVATANVWRSKMAEFTGKKFLQNSGVIDTIYNQLPAKVAAGDSVAIQEAEEIFKALEAEERVGSDKLAQIKANFEKNVQEAASLPEHPNKTSNSNSTQEEAVSQEPVTNITDNAVDLISSDAFSLDALLGMNLAIDPE